MIAPQKSPLDQTIGLDQMTRYWAATALFQEINLLTRYVRDVALGENKRAYVVRFQVTLHPHRRQQAYDAYTTVSFFRQQPSAAAATRPATESAKQDPAAQMPKGPTRSYGQILERVDNLRASRDQTGRGLKVIPLLVSDNLEGALEAKSLSVLREYALSIMAVVQGFGIGGDISRRSSNLQALVGRELNSLLSVARANDNTLRVRFGAMQQPGAFLSMVPRNQTVTVLLVLDDYTSKPSDAAAKEAIESIRALAKTEFMDATTGRVLPIDQQAFHQDLDSALKRYNIDIDESKPSVAATLRAVQLADEDLFKTALEGLAADATGGKDKNEEVVKIYRDEIWLDAASLLGALPYSTTSFPLPQQPKDAGLENQALLAMDDGKELKIIVDGAERLAGSSVTASLSVHETTSPEPPAPTCGTSAPAGVGVPDLTLMSLRTAQKPDGRLELVLPSIKSLDHCGDGKHCALTLKVRVDRGRWRSSSTKDFCQIRYHTVKEEAPSPTFSVSVGSRTILCARSEASGRAPVLRVVRQAADWRSDAARGRRQREACRAARWPRRRDAAAVRSHGSESDEGRARRVGTRRTGCDHGRSPDRHGWQSGKAAADPGHVRGIRPRAAASANDGDNDREQDRFRLTRPRPRPSPRANARRARSRCSPCRRRCRPV